MGILDKFFPMPLFEGEGAGGGGEGGEGGAGEGGEGGAGNLGEALGRGGATKQIQGGAGEGGQGGDPFYSTFQDQDLAQVAQRAGWDSPEAAVKSYRELETMMSGKMDGFIKIPGEGATEEEIGAYHTAHGRPETPENYEVPKLNNIPEGDTTPQWFTQIAHKVGLNQDQYNTIMGAYDELVEEVGMQEDTALDEDARAGNDALQEKWGADYAAKVAIGNRAVNALDLTSDEIIGLQATLGVERATEMLVGIGALVGSDQSVGFGGDGGGSPFSGDAAWAQTELTKLTNNTQFMEKAANPAMHLSDPAFKPLLDRYNRCRDILSRAKTGVA